MAWTWDSAAITFDSGAWTFDGTNNTGLSEWTWDNAGQTFDNTTWTFDGTAAGEVTPPSTPVVSRETAPQTHYAGVRLDRYNDDDEVMRMVLAKFAEIAR